MTNLEKLIGIHTGMLEENPYCYFELAYTRKTGWMAWICSNMREDDPDRVVLANGQGSTPEEAALNALETMGQTAAAPVTSVSLDDVQPVVQALTGMLHSATPHPQENPTMHAAWKTGSAAVFEFLSKHPLS